MRHILRALPDVLPESFPAQLDSIDEGTLAGVTALLSDIFSFYPGTRNDTCDFEYDPASIAHSAPAKTTDRSIVGLVGGHAHLLRIDLTTAHLYSLHCWARIQRIKV